MRAVSARQLSVRREKLFEWNKILCSVMTAQNNNNTFLIPKSSDSNTKSISQTIDAEQNQKRQWQWLT